ncbi:hypothetical protein TNCV_2356511 [Trichonephila clavipes]|nr:hypothetical protein TNCV_2356511 [Trichonephila clavipes]
MLEKVLENWTSRLDNIRASLGSPMPEIIFKIYSVKRVIKKYYREHFWSKFYQKNNQNVWFRQLLSIPRWPRDRAAVDFGIATGHDCLSKHLNMIGIIQIPLC